MERPAPPVGSSLPRVDGVAKVTGRAHYLDDLDAPGAWHGATVRSQIAHGVLEGFDLDPGFDWTQVTVVTAADIAALGLQGRLCCLSTLGGSKGTLFMVADGMGGAAAGEIASAMAVDVVLGELRSTWITQKTDSTEAFVRAIKQATKAANEQINAFAASHPNV